MRRACGVLLAMLAAVVLAEELPPLPGMTASNPVADPFAAQVPMVLPPLPQGKPPELPPLPSATPLPSLPPGLRVVLTRENGQAVLSTGEAGALSIPVTHGQPVWIAGQNYLPEVDPRSVRLYLAPKGRLMWQASLAGSALPVVPPDLNQVRFIPPLSAGINPGLRTRSGSALPGNPLLGTPASNQGGQNVASTVNPVVSPNLPTTSGVR